MKVREARQDDGGDVAEQCNAHAVEGCAEEIKLTEGEHAGEHGQSCGEKEWGLEEDLAVAERETTEDRAKEDGSHAVAGVEAEP